MLVVVKDKKQINGIQIRKKMGQELLKAFF